LAGWPALPMLIAVKLFSMIDHTAADPQTVVVDDQEPSSDRPSLRSTVQRTVQDGRASQGTGPLSTNGQGRL
jgi:hypothetical protein